VERGDVRDGISTEDLESSLAALNRTKLCANLAAHSRKTSVGAVAAAGRTHDLEWCGV
jgi:hypothetical protein